MTAETTAGLPVRTRYTEAELRLMDRWMDAHGDDPADWPEDVRLAYANAIANERARGAL